MNFAILWVFVKVFSAKFGGHGVLWRSKSEQFTKDFSCVGVVGLEKSFLHENHIFFYQLAKVYRWWEDGNNIWYNLQFNKIKFFTIKIPIS